IPDDARDLHALSIVREQPESLVEIGGLTLRRNGQRSRHAASRPADLSDPELCLSVLEPGHDLARVAHGAEGVAGRGRVWVQRDGIEVLLALGSVDTGQVAIEGDPVSDPRGPEEPTEHHLRARVAGLDAAVEDLQKLNVLLRIRLAEPEARRVHLVPELP